MNQDGPPGRHLQPVYDEDVPYDAYEDRYETHPTAVHADRETELTVLATLINYPDTATTVTGLIEGTDLHWPAHEQIWNAWHHLNDTDGVPPDAVLIGAHLNKHQHREASRLLPDLVTRPTSPALATQHATLVLQYSKKRALLQLATGITTALTTDRIADLDSAFGEAMQRVDEVVGRYGTTDRGSRRTDLTWVLNGQAPAIDPPTICHRTDGTALFYAGKVNGLFGDPETAKTWLAQIAGVEALNTGGTFAMVDVDHNGPEHTATRLILLGAEARHIANPDKFRYFQPDAPDDLHAVISEITTWAPTVTIIDSLGEVFPMLGVSTIDSDELTAALRQVCARPAAAGSCVITIDHLPKGTDARASGYAIGSIAKKRMIRGSYIRCEAITQPAPGKIGRVSLIIEKDTSGELRRTSNGKNAGVFTLDSQTIPGSTTWSIGHEETPKNDDGTFRPTGLMELVSKHIENDDQCSFTDIKRSVQGKDKWLRAAIELLVTEGFVARMPGPRGSKLHHSLVHYRQSEDSHAQSGS